MKLQQRNRIYYIVKRVPKRFEKIDPRKQVWISLHTDSLEDAQRRAPEVWEGQLAGWDALKAGDTTNAEKRYEAARNLAQQRGYRFLTVERVAELPIAELYDRIDQAFDKRGRHVPALSDAMLGGAKKPEITINGALSAYWPLTADQLQGKSKDQIRRWENPRKKAVRNFISVVGDVNLSDLTPDDFLDFRDWLMDLVREGKIKPSSANKDLTHLGGVLKTVNNMKRLGLALNVSDLQLRNEAAGIRPPFSSDWIRDKILADGALGGLNAEARCLLLGMINTGYRPSEGACLTRDQIHLDCEVPHISIEPVGRTLKTAHAVRMIPLLGVSLEAFQQFPDGFERYHNSGAPSATLNKFLESAGLKETPNHTTYSFRHAFQDRMIAAEVDDRVRRDLFGHALTENKYGKGASIEHKRRVLEPISF